MNQEDFDRFARNPLYESAARFVDVNKGVTLILFNLQRNNIFVKAVEVIRPPGRVHEEYWDTYALFPQHKSANARHYLYSAGIMYRLDKKREVEWSSDSFATVYTRGSLKKAVNWLYKRGDPISEKVADMANQLLFDFLP